jgi:hypothetical protein
MGEIEVPAPGEKMSQSGKVVGGRYDRHNFDALPHRPFPETFA